MVFVPPAVFSGVNRRVPSEPVVANVARLTWNDALSAETPLWDASLPSPLSCLIFAFPG